MTKISIGRADYKRTVAKEAEMALHNRYFESNPVLNDEQTSLLARPGLRKVATVGSGPVRAVYSAPGAFNGDLFVVSGLDLYRFTNAGVATFLGTVGTTINSTPSMVATGTFGEKPNYLYVCDGGILYLYTEDGFGIGVLVASANAVNNDTVTINTTVYKFTTGSVDAGTPAGTGANPWLVKLGVDAATSLNNLFVAISATGTPGTEYSTVLTAHTTVGTQALTATQLVVRALTPGAVPNSYPTTETSANLAWSNATLTGGGAPNLTQVYLPNDVGAISLAHIDGYVIVVPAQGEDINGRFYWIQPGETTIDPLDYATAERSPDAILQVKVFSDQIMFLGQNTAENWVATGAADSPFQRFQGVLFDRGIWEGTAVQVKESVLVVDSEGQVLQLTGGAKVVSNPSIEQRLREAIELQRAS